MNKYALGTIVGTAMFPLLKGKGSKVKLGVGRFYSIVLENILIQQSEKTWISHRVLKNTITNKIKKMVFYDKKDEDFINILKPILFDRQGLFGYSFSLEAKYNCEDDGITEYGEAIATYKWDFTIIFASPRDVSNLPEKQYEIIMKKVKNLIVNSFYEYISSEENLRHDHNFKINTDQTQFAIYKGIQDHSDPRNNFKPIVIEKEDGIWEPYEETKKTHTKLRIR